MPRQEATLSIPFPLGGVDVEKAFVRQPAGAPGPYGQMATTPVAHNVRALEVATGRVRGASRPGLTKWLNLVVDGTPDVTAPDDLSDLQVWYDADDTATVWQDSGRTTPATADGDPVGAWDDKSGNARHFTQATAGKRPTLKLNVQNSRDVLRFDGVDDVLSTASYVIGSGPGLTYFAVADPGTVAAAHILMDARVGGTNRHVVYTDTNPKWVYSTTVDTVTEITATTSCVVLVAVFGGAGNSSFTVNGEMSGPHSMANVSTDGQAVGASLIESFFWDGDVMEMGMYSRALGQSERDSLAAHLLSKWGL